MKNESLSDSVLLSTKLKMPSPRHGYIIRHELFSVLERSHSMKVVYVKGAAGTGKTTLVSSFVRESGLRNASWITLDETNNNAFSFWHYFAAAAKNFLGDLFEDILSLLRSNFETSHIQNLLAMMINCLCGDDDYYIILDDFQCIKDKTLIGTLEFFIKSMPDNLHLIMLSREDPLLYLGELAVSGKLLFIDGNMLRFSKEESMKFLKETLQLSDSEDDLMRMNNFAEGWIGGLQLVAAAGGNKNSLLNAAGSAVAADYLTREIFRMLADDERRFLIATSILPYFDKEISTYLIGDMDFAIIVKSLIGKNLFITCIDEEAGIYRYHNILGEYLKQQFSLLSKESQAAYRRKAAEILEMKGDKEEAVYQLYKAEDYKEAMKLLKRMDETVEAWALIDKLPIDYLLADINFSLQCLMYNFGIINIARCYEISTALYEREEYKGIRGFLQYLFQYTAPKGPANLSIPKPLSVEDINNLVLSPVAQSLLFFENANILLDYKDYENAGIYTDKAIETGGKSNIFVYFYSISTKAQILEETGRLNESLGIYTQMKDYIRSLRTMDALAYNYYIGIIGVYHKRMDELNSRRALEAVNEIITNGCIPQDIIAVGYDYHAAEHELLFGDPEKGADIINRIINGIFSRNFRQIDRLILNMYSQNLLSDEISAHFVEEVETTGLKKSSFTSQILYSRIMFDSGYKEKAEKVIENILSFARERKNMLRLVEADLLKIRFLSSDPKNHERIISNLLREAVYYAFNDRIIQPFFLDKKLLGPYLEKLLKSDAANLNKGEHQFVVDVLKIIAGNFQQNSKETLSSRELEVLKELAKGLTNPEIADNLCISLSTVKTHINNIYGKLQVSSRLSAVKEAQKSGILY